MRILLTNDDGIFSPGLAAMAAVLRKMGEVTIAAPAAEQSGVGPAITFLTPVTVKKAYRGAEFWGYAVEGTPVDCVKVGVSSLMTERPDLIVSGINNGINAGINILYSGTVAAALEGAWQGITSVAVSTQFTDLNRNDYVTRAADAAGAIIEKLLKNVKKPGELFNLNIPFAALEAGSKRQVAVVPMDRTPYWKEFDQRNDPSGRRYYWLSGRPNHEKIKGESDLGRLSEGMITVTPLDVDMSKRSLMSEMDAWDLSLNSDFQFSQREGTEDQGFQLFRWIDKPTDRSDAAR